MIFNQRNGGLGEKNLTRLCHVHNALGGVDSPTGDTNRPINIVDTGDRADMNPHA
jgi:hypothetical protein